MAWLYLLVAGVLEIVWATAMKHSEGFSKLWPTALTASAMLGSFWFLALALRSLPLGTAYTVWTGIGAVGAFAVGIIMLGEEASAARFVAAGLILSGLIVMRFAAPS